MKWRSEHGYDIIYNTLKYTRGTYIHYLCVIQREALLESPAPPHWIQSLEPLQATQGKGVVTAFEIIPRALD